MKAIIIFSGGQDSTTCLFIARELYGTKDIKAITIDYGQRHKCELEASWRICNMFGIEREIISVPQILKGMSPLINPDAKVEQYESYNQLPGGLENTFVPARNLLFLTIAANRAYVDGAEIIMTGVSQEDFGGYPDCRIEFIIQAGSTINEALEPAVPIKIRTPLIYKSKKDTVEIAYGLGQDCMTALAYSHTCYNGQYPPCGKCHACLLRQKGFDEFGIEDPLISRARREGLIK
jgi:7-cyano-7-deazaguanine synthase